MRALCGKDGRTGRWHMVDLLACGFLIGVAWSGYAALQVTSGRWRQGPPVLAGRPPVDLLVTFPGLDASLVRTLAVGDTEVDSEGREVARIVEMRPPQPETVSVRFGDQEWSRQVETGSGRFDVPVTLRVLADLRGDSLYYQGRLLGSGTTLRFSTGRYEIRGIVYDAGWIRMVVKTSRMSVDAARRLAAGSTEIDVDGRVIARLLKVQHVYVAVPGDDRQFVISEIPMEAFYAPQPHAPRPKWISRKRHQPEREAAREYLLTLLVELRCTFERGRIFFKATNLSPLYQAVPLALGGVEFQAQVMNIAPFRTGRLTGEWQRG